MRNHLQNGSLRWESPECRDSFYSVLKNPDHTAFGRLYKSQPAWQTDLGNAVEHCLNALADTGKFKGDLDLFWAPDLEPGRKVTFRSSELSWIGFLGDTETSGTLAVLESKFLELSALNSVKKCPNKYYDPRHIKLSTAESVLETSVLFNAKCVPDSVREQRITSKRRDASTPRHEYRWSVSLLKEGDEFWFGGQGCLKTITPLNRSQILVRWSGSWDILETMKRKILGKTHHDECIRYENGNTRPIRVFQPCKQKATFS